MSIQTVSPIEGKTIDQLREESRRELALKLLYVFASILAETILLAIFLIWNNKINFNNGLSLVLAIGSIFSGLIGSAITFYFSSKTN